MSTTSFSIPYRATWWLVFAALSLPLAWLVGQALTGGLGANPIEAINRYLGDWALRMVLVALAATPLKILFGWRWPVRMRRMLGLWAFAYVTLHIANYVAIDQFLAWNDIWKDIIKRNFITVGMIAFLILSALAATSWNGAIKRMGAKSWLRLHKDRKSTRLNSSHLGISYAVFCLKKKKKKQKNKEKKKKKKEKRHSTAHSLMYIDSL